MLSLHTNAASLSTQNSLGSTNKALSTSMTRLGTGLRVNSAMDDAAGLQIATRLNAQTSGMKVAQKIPKTVFRCFKLPKVQWTKSKTC